MRVLVAVGGSDRSERALEAALERAEAAGDDVTVAVADGAPTVEDAAGVERWVEEYLADASSSADVRHLEGEPGPAIVELAETEGFDRIVLGSGRESPLGKVQLGAAAEFVLLNADMPVTLVR